MKAIKRRLFLSLILPAALLTMGHVGSPDVFFQGAAGPYEVRVTVRPPEVIPGVAELSVRVEGARSVSVRPARWDAGPAGAPAPEPARPVRGAPGLYSAQVWLLTASSYALEIEVTGGAGAGRVSVPVAAAPVRRAAMSRAVGGLLASLLLALLAGGVQLAGAAVREGTLVPGEIPGPERRTRARAAAAGAALLAVLALIAGQRWWGRVDAEHRGKLYQPFQLSAAATVQGAQRVLALRLDDPRWLQRRALLAPDHGKLMHLFLLREPGHGAFAHLHPVPVDDQAFEAALPELPAGRYRLYADVTEETGFAHTLTGRVEVPPAPRPDPAAEPELAADEDDSWQVGPSERHPAFAWRNREPLAAGRDTTLRFALLGGDGRPAVLEPYMGMWGHAVVARDDGRVFVHLHPSGTISMAAQQIFERRWEDGDPHAEHPGHPSPGHRSPAELAFPYAFPAPGRYRIWVQAKSGGEVATGVFDARVAGRVSR
jgi:hypothetical protein